MNSDDIQKFRPAFIGGWVEKPRGHRPPIRMLGAPCALPLPSPQLWHQWIATKHSISGIIGIIDGIGFLTTSLDLPLGVQLFQNFQLRGRGFDPWPHLCPWTPLEAPPQTLIIGSRWAIAMVPGTPPNQWLSATYASISPANTCVIRSHNSGIRRLHTGPRLMGYEHLYFIRK